MPSERRSSKMGCCCSRLCRYFLRLEIATASPFRNPGQINELMATTSDELEQYRQIDRERMASEADMARKKGLRRWNRLMPADEVRVCVCVRVFFFVLVCLLQVYTSSQEGLDRDDCPVTAPLPSILPQPFGRLSFPHPPCRRAGARLAGPGGRRRRHRQGRGTRGRSGRRRRGSRRRDGVGGGRRRAGVESRDEEEEAGGGLLGRVDGLAGDERREVERGLKDWELKAMNERSHVLVDSPCFRFSLMSFFPNCVYLRVVRVVYGFHPLLIDTGAGESDLVWSCTAENSPARARNSSTSRL